MKNLINELGKIKEIHYTNDKMEKLYELQDNIEKKGIDLYSTDFENIVDIDYLEERAKYELENGGLERLYYFLPSDKLGNPYMYDYFKINAYGNAEVATTEDIDNVIEEIIDILEDLQEEKIIEEYEEKIISVETKEQIKDIIKELNDNEEVGDKTFDNIIYEIIIPKLEKDFNCNLENEQGTNYENVIRENY